MYNIDDADFLKYHSLVNSIPNEYKSKLKQENITLNMYESILSKISKKTFTTKLCYAIQLGNKKDTGQRTYEQKWNQLLEKELNWKQIYTLPFKATIDSMVRNFQYKFIHRIIPINKYLFACKLISSSI